MRHVKGYIKDLRSDVTECIGCGCLVIGDSPMCLSCKIAKQTKQWYIGIPFKGWIYIAIIDFIVCAIFFGTMYFFTS